MGGSTQTSTTTQAGGTTGVLPELQPYVSRLGQYAAQALDFPELQLSRFAQDQPVPVPGLSPYEQAAGQMIGQRLAQGIPQSTQEQVAFGQLATLPQYVGQRVPLSGWTGGALGTAGQMAGTAGVLTPQEQFSSGWLQGLAQTPPPFVGQQVPLSPFTTRGMDTAQQLATAAGQINPVTQSGIAGLQSLAGSPGGGITPAVQAAIQGLESTIIPTVQNQAARTGLAASGFLPMEIGRQYAGQLVPLYMAGLQQQGQAASALGELGEAMAGRGLAGLQTLAGAQAAAGQAEQGLGIEALSRQLQGLGLQQQAVGQLTGLGQTAVARQLSGLQALRDMQAASGQMEQAQATDALVRQMQTAIGISPELRAMGLREEQRPIEAIQEALSFGGITRGIEQQQAQAAQDAYMRAREISLGLVNPFGGFATAGAATPVTSRTRTEDSGGWGFGK